MEQPSQTSKKRSGTVAGMKDGLKKATTDMLVLFLLRQKPMYVLAPPRLVRKKPS